MGEITGMVDYKRFVREERDSFVRMVDSLTSVGTVHEYFNTFVALGYKGKIHDYQISKKKANGNSYVIVFVGALNNGEAIKNKLLPLGYTFDSSTIAEVVLTTYIEWQESVFTFLGGNFAFAIWDDEKQKLIIANKGEKTIYYYVDSNRLLFTTRKSTLLTDNLFNIKEDEDVSVLSDKHYLSFTAKGVQLHDTRWNGYKK